MTHNLPLEILQAIFKHAISQEAKDLFTPLPYDYTRIKGVVEASPKLAEIVHSIPEDVVYVDKLGPALRKFSSGTAWHVHVDACRGDEVSELVGVLADFAHLESLTIPICRPEPLTSVLSRLPFTERLRSLDLRADPVLFPLSELHLSLPNLVRLRLNANKGRWKVSSLPWKDPEILAAKLVLALKGCPSLQHISFHYHLEQNSLFSNALNEHGSSIDHLVPSEGYERHYTECPFCLVSYDFSIAASREKKVTYILAKALPALQKVAWTNAWASESSLQAGDESCQRTISIFRRIADSGVEIILLRRGEHSFMDD